MDTQHAADAVQLMAAISDTQENMIRLREARVQLELQLKDVNEQMDADIAALAELQESLNAAIAHATRKAIGD